MDDYGNDCESLREQLDAMRKRAEQAEAVRDELARMVAQSETALAAMRQRAEAAEAERDALNAQLAAVPVAALRLYWEIGWIPGKFAFESGDKREAYVAVAAWLATLPQEVQP